MIRIALDAMGGDFAPKTNVIGAMEAVKKYNDIEIYTKDMDYQHNKLIWDNRMTMDYLKRIAHNLMN